MLSAATNGLWAKDWVRKWEKTGRQVNTLLFSVFTYDLMTGTKYKMPPAASFSLCWGRGWVMADFYWTSSNCTLWTNGFVNKCFQGQEWASCLNTSPKPNRMHLCDICKLWKHCVLIQNSPLHISKWLKSLCRTHDSTKSSTTCGCRREAQEESTRPLPETPLTFPTTTVWANLRWGSISQSTFAGDMRSLIYLGPQTDKKLLRAAVLLQKWSLPCFQVELVQLLVDGVNYLIECEKKLEKGQDIRVPAPIAQFKK